MGLTYQAAEQLCLIKGSQSRLADLGVFQRGAHGQPLDQVVEVGGH